MTSAASLTCSKDAEVKGDCIALEQEKIVEPSQKEDQSSRNGQLTHPGSHMSSSWFNIIFKTLWALGCQHAKTLEVNLIL